MTRLKLRTGDTGGMYSDESESLTLPLDSALCDACPGCDDVCNSKSMLYLIHPSLFSQIVNVARANGELFSNEIPHAHMDSQNARSDDIIEGMTVG